MTTLVLCAKSHDFVMSVSVRRVHVVFSTTGFKDGGKPCRKTSEPSRCGEASRKPRALNRVQTQAIGALAHAGFLPIELPERPPIGGANEKTFVKNIK